MILVVIFFCFSGELSDVGQGGGGGEDQAEAGEEHGERQQVNFLKSLKLANFFW